MALASGAETPARSNTCNLWQTCASNAGKYPGGPNGQKLGTCDDPAVVTQPIFIENGYPPAKMLNSVGTDAMAAACPYMDLSNPICCNQDNA